MAQLENHLVIFVKAPQRGAVKTRLARAIGPGPAQRFARETACTVIRRLCRDARWRCWLAVTPDRFARRGRFWPKGPRRLPQGPGGLGARMARAVRALPPGPVVIVGSDIPALGPRHVAEAFRALGRAQAVFGPAADGGYWLVGLSRRPASLVPFRNVAWSTERALADTRANLPAHARVRYLETLEDIDDADSWRRWRRSANHERGKYTGLPPSCLPPQAGGGAKEQSPPPLAGEGLGGGAAPTRPRPRAP